MLDERQRTKADVALAQPTLLVAAVPATPGVGEAKAAQRPIAKRFAHDAEEGYRDLHPGRLR